MIRTYRVEHDPAIKGFAVDTQVPQFDGVHHLRYSGLADLASQRREWYQSRLGYAVATEFREDGKVMGLALNHPDGGPRLALRLDPGKARASSDGFDYFSIGVESDNGVGAIGLWLQNMSAGRATVGYSVAPRTGVAGSPPARGRY